MGHAGRSQQVDSNHDGEAGKGFVAESWLVRVGDSLFAEEPEGAWAVGIKVVDAETWSRVEKGNSRASRRPDWRSARRSSSKSPVRRKR